ncbi:MAG: T9SS type A sorting domain-containing protein [Bacteroidia bacterium]
MRYVLTLPLLLFLAAQALGQSLSLPTVSAAGTTSSQPTFNLSFTVGEAGTGTFTQNPLILTAGFQQSDPSGIPLTAISFDIVARWEGSTAIIQTAVLSDLELRHWTLERADENGVFAKTETIDAPETSSHRWEDQPGNSAETWRYRLRVSDADGQNWYSPVVELHLSESPLQAVLYPNPTSTEAFLSFHLEKEASLQLYDASGKFIRSSTLIRAMASSPLR